jgi:hypothetical protein
MRLDDVKTGADPSSGISLGDALRLPKRHPAWRRREAQSGSRKKLTCSSVPTARRKPNIVSFAAGRQCRWSTCMERENLAGDAKGKGASGSNREAESTDAPERGGLPRSIMPVERRGWVSAFEIGSTGNGRNPIFNGRRQPSCGDTSRMTRECQVRICERLGVKFPGPTRPK